MEVSGAPERGLVVVHAAGYPDGGAGGTVRVEGYAAAPESHLEMLVLDVEGPVCQQADTTLGPPHLLSWFARTCPVSAGRTYEVRVGWPSPAGGADDVWQSYEVTVG